MRNINFYSRAASSLILVGSLFILGACQRPQNAMVAEFQKTSDAMLAGMVSRVVASRASVRSGGSYGNDQFGGTSQFQFGNQLYRPHGSGLHNDTAVCLNLAQQYPKEFKYYYAMVGVLTQCLERQLVGSSNALFGSLYPFMGDQGQAYLRYLVDFRNTSGQFLHIPYGLGYQWGLNQSWGFGNDPLLLWNILGGQGQGFSFGG